jgi:DNA recombination protein Rad52
MRSYEDVIKDLDSKIPADAVETRQGGGTRALSYLPGWYVIDRLNKVLGIGNWSYTSDVTKVFEGERNGKFATGYLAKVRLAVELPNAKVCEFTDIGSGDGIDANPSKSHESAAKEAVTDGLKRCAKNLGISMGLGLYDKSGDGVEEAEKPAAKAPAPAAKPQAVAEPKGFNRELAQKKVVELVKVIGQLKRGDPENIRAEIKAKYNVESSKDLTDEQIQSFIKDLETKIKE